ncbi:MAG: hypothetical protein HDT44_09065, partial [Ruminococcaceae bacterium]|nr:hypothetical protein [Oscillospiraceae bacterium]
IDGLGGLSDAVQCLYDMIESGEEEEKKSSSKKKGSTKKHNNTKVRSRKSVSAHEIDEQRAVSLLNMICNGDVVYEDGKFVSAEEW